MNRPMRRFLLRFCRDFHVWNPDALEKTIPAVLLDEWIAFYILDHEEEQQRYDAMAIKMGLR